VCLYVQIKWSKDDCYILTASSDGTCKLWDAFALSPLMGYGLFNHKRGATSMPGTAHGSILMNPGTPGGDLSTLGGGIPSTQSPYLRYTLAATPPLFVYCTAFQEYASPSVPPPPAVPGTANVSESFEKQYTSARSGPPTEYMDGHVRAVCPRVITGSADGRLRVWDGESFMGCIKSERSVSAAARASASAASGTEDDLDDDFAPHDGKVQAIAIDERTK
jgi:WD40 repeat protein